jgi:hypothetical protein
MSLPFDTPAPPSVSSRRSFPVRFLAASILCAALVSSVAPPAAAETADAARAAAERFGSALLSSRAAALREVLPSEGKVHLSLKRLGPEEGSFASGQVEAVFRDFLAKGAVRGFTLVSVTSDGRTAAWAVARAEVVDRDGRTARVGFRLSLEPEGSRWILREVREAPE